MATWLIREGRLLGDAEAIVTGLCERLIAAGFPLIRMRIGQRMTNPMFAAWGLVWEPGAVAFHNIDYSILETEVYLASPFHAVIETRAPVRRRLDMLQDDDQQILHDLRALGGVDYLATPLEYGDGSVQVAAFVLSEVLSEADSLILTELRHAIAAALEPVAMRSNMRSVMTTYLGHESAERILSGAIRRGDIVHIDAVVMFADLCGFTTLSEMRPEAELLGILDTYFEAVVTAVHAKGGEVLKFLGDGILAIFPITEDTPAKAACTAAVEAVRMAEATLASPDRIASEGEPAEWFAAALHIGPVVYGNIGSRDRLDFTVVGPTVNLVSRLEDVAKRTRQQIICSSEFDAAWGGTSNSLGERMLKGFSSPREVRAI